MSSFARIASAVLALAALTGCARAPQPVHSFAEGKPDKLSDWHLVEARDGRLVPNTDVVPYDLNTPLFSDYAHKFRTLWMPKGTAAKYDAEGAFDFPVGTVLTKTFFYPKTGGDAKAVARTYDTSRDFAAGSANEALDLATVRLIETRILVRREKGWEAIPYVWNAAQTDAELARTGDAIPLELVDTEASKAGRDESRPANAREAFTYVVPNENQCAGCHVTNVKAKAIEPLGPRARHLNRDYAYAAGAENQLAHWTKLGMLAGAPDAAQTPRDANWHDAKAPVAERARAYLDVNCSMCHSPTGPANTTALDLRSANTDLRRLGLCKPPVAAGRGTGDRLFDIVPGKPDDSILLYRVTSNEAGVMMPEMGRNTTHKEGVELIRDWIAATSGNCDA